MRRASRKAERDNERVLTRWSEPGAAGFFSWLADVRPCILTRRNKWEPVSLEPWQREILADALACDAEGQFLRPICLTCMPRRHSKSTLWALVVLWLLTSRRNLTIQALGNSEDHCRRVQMKRLAGIIRNTPALAAIVQPANLSNMKIELPELGNVVQGSASNLSTSFGDKLNVLWVSDFHEVDLAVYDALQASLLDSEGTLILLDANVDPEGGHVHALEREAEQDARIYARHVEYADFDDFCLRAPAWIDRSKARQMQRTQLPTAFDRDILGKRSSAKNALFPADVIEVCRAEIPHPFPPERLPDLTCGRKYVIGGGLDRSKKLFGGDNTAWTVTMKLAATDGEPEYVVLNQEVVVPNHSRLIKRAILRDHERYKLDNVVLENYETTDLKPWMDDQRISCELVSAHDTNQNLSFVELYRIAKEGRLRFSLDLVTLSDEMRTFIYEEKRDGKYSFGHCSQKFHDDTVYSLNWSVFATRANVLTLYTLGRIVCSSLSPHRRLCFLMGGNMELVCKHDCEAFHRVASMFDNFKRLRLDDDVTLADFFAARVKLTGPRVYQGV